MSIAIGGKMISKTANIYKYFLVTIKEYYNSEYYKLENIRFDSIIYLLDEYLKLEEEIRKSSDSRKLIRSRKALLNNIIFYFENSPFREGSEFKRDIENFLKFIQRSKSNKNGDNEDIEDKNYNDIFYSISEIYKKILNINILDYWISIILNGCKSFDEVDKVVECYINELLYKGYSLRYLSEWWRDSFKGIFDIINEDELRSFVERFRELSNHKDRNYKIILKYNLPDKIKKELNEKQIISIGDIEYKLILEEYKNSIIEINPSNKKFFESNKVTYCEVVVNSCDKYSAIEKVVFPLQEYSEIYKIVDKSVSNVDISTYLIEEDGKFIEKNLSKVSGYSRELNDREREDIEDFIVLRDELRYKKFNNISISEIESVINLMHKSLDNTAENNLLNNWTCIENLVKSYAGKSIIDTVNSIIPKVICMYIMKQKMNILWERIYPLLDKRISNEELELCRASEKSNKYNTEAFAKYLLSDDAEELYKSITYVTIQRDLAELNKFISQPEELIKYIDTIEIAIINSINSIYRTRNDLVHNGGKLHDYTQYQLCNLQYYLNRLLGTMIFHIKRNPSLTITEILYSIDYSYKAYKNELVDLKNEINNTKNKKENKDKKQKEFTPIRNQIILNFDIKKIIYVNYLYI